MRLIGWRMAAALVVALAVQVAVNFANDYFDGVRGVDTVDRRGPRRAVASGLVAPERMRSAIVAALAVAAAAGLALAAAVGWQLLLVGLACFAAAIGYSGGPRPYASAGLGEVFVFVFFGLVATMGSAYVQDEHLRWLPAVAAVPVGLLSVALLVVNNLRDIPSDRATGKNTLAVHLGDARTRYLYVGLLVLSFVAVPLVSGLGDRPLGALALAAVLLARRPVVSVLEGDSGTALVPVLEATGRVQLVFGVLFATGIYLSA
jgi:1,4-dihydroxy-2-naphthoate octaprenyltransferase